MKAQLSFRLRPISGSTFEYVQASCLLSIVHAVPSLFGNICIAPGIMRNRPSSNLFPVATLTLVARVDEQEYS